MNIALIVFAGSGTRINSSLPKQFIKIKEKELVVYTIEKFEKSPVIDEIILVTHKDYLDLVESFIDKYHLTKVKYIIPGGSSRQESVKLGLLNTDYDENDNILIHDGDRPLVSEEIIECSVKTLQKYQACCVYIPHNEALNTVSNLGRTKLIEGVEADVQTPQSFKYGLIKKYHVLKEKESFSDDTGLVEKDVEVKYIHGDKMNFKVTTDIDLEAIKSIIC